MNPRFKLFLATFIAVSLAITVGALAWRWRETGDVAAIFAGPKPVRPVLLLAMPLLMWALLIFADHSMVDEKREYLPRERLWFINFTLVTHFLLLVAGQAWMAATYLGSARPDPEFFIRLMVAFMGLGMAVRGNFFAKLPPPGKDRTGAFTRTSRQTAVTLVLMGLALTACAVSLPMKALLVALGGAFAILLILTRAQRRARVQP